LYASKNLGQNFLKDKKTLDYVFDFCLKQPVSSYIEIGGGTGVLSRVLSSLEKELCIVEIDKEMSHILSSFFCKENKVKVINKDFLSVKDDFVKKDTSVVANIPYNITSDIIEKIFKQDVLPVYSLLMVQKEFAKRIVRRENISVLNSFLHVFSKINIERYVSKNFFFPRPKVDSALISVFSVKEEKEVRVAYLDFLKKMYSGKRKTVAKNLNRFYGLKLNGEIFRKRVLQVSPEELFELFTEYVFHHVL